MNARVRELKTEIFLLRTAINAHEKVKQGLLETLGKLRAENTKLREALYGEYCDCEVKEATIIPSTHRVSCKYRTVMRRIIS